MSLYLDPAIDRTHSYMWFSLSYKKASTIDIDGSMVYMIGYKDISEYTDIKL